MVSATVLPATPGAYTSPASILKDLLRPFRSTMTATRLPGSKEGKAPSPQPEPDGARPAMLSKMSSARTPACSAGLPGNTSATTSRHVSDSTVQGTVPFSRPSLRPIPEYGAPLLRRDRRASYSAGDKRTVLGSPNDANISLEAARTAAAVSSTASISAHVCSNAGAEEHRPVPLPRRARPTRPLALP